MSLDSLRHGFVAVTALVIAGPLAFDAPASANDKAQSGAGRSDSLHVQLGPRPFFLLDAMASSGLKNDLQRCAAETDRYEAHPFSIGHRGAPMQFPEHTKESYIAAARMGAGILECDVTFTADAELVCRHGQCDLHRTTDIVARPDLRGFCKVPPEFDPGNGALLNASEIRCCASDLTLAQFKSLNGKMDAANRSATTVDEYLNATASWRTDLYATRGTLLSHKESIQLFHKLGTGFTPELKGGDADDIAAIFGSQANYARAMIKDYTDAGISPREVWAQSFNIEDLYTWIEDYPAYGKQAVALDGRSVADQVSSPPSVDDFQALKDAGVNIVAPPMPVLLDSDGNGGIVPSQYAKNAKKAKLDIITWTLERSGRIIDGVPESTFYYSTTLDSLQNDGDILRTIDVLAREVGVIGLFSDWPATTTFYANCKQVKHFGASEDQ